jgi:hypothetical protein
MSLYNDQSIHYRRLLHTKRMEKIQNNVPIWAAFTGEQTRHPKVNKFGASKDIRPTGQPIEKINDFRGEGRLDIDIPVFYPLTGAGVSGGKQLLGNEEQVKFANKTTQIWQKRHGVLVQDNKISRQTLKNPEFVKELMDNAADKLVDWGTRWLAHQVPLTFLQGKCEHLCEATTDGGRGQTRTSHMNIYVAGSGRVSFSTTHATYEAAVASALSGLTDTSSDHMSTEVIENMIYVASHNHKIQPINFGGKMVYPIVMSDAAILQLQQDSKWQDAQKSAFQGHKEMHPLLSGKVEGVYRRALILSDETVPAAYINGDSAFSATRSTTATTAGVSYGLTNPLATPVDTGNRKPAILFGKSAICMGQASNWGFEREDWDYGQRQTEGMDAIIGMEIADIIDSDGFFGVGGNNRYENVSSLIAFTYSPSDADWT